MRRRIAVALWAAALWSIPSVADAHGIGGRQDLPVPLSVFVVAAGIVLVVSFVALAVLWPHPRLQEPPGVRSFGGRWWSLTRRVLGWLGLAALFLVVASGLTGNPASSGNPAPVLVFVVFWLVVPFLAAFLVDVYPAIDPWKKAATLLGIGDRERPELIERVGFMPAAGGLLAFTWLELIAPVTNPAALAVAALVYTVALLAAMAVMGRETGSQTVDAFAVYNRLYGGMAPVSNDGTLARRGWLRGLVEIPERRGLAFFVVAMIGTVTYDGASGTPWWGEQIELPVARAFETLGLSLRWASVLAQTLAWGITVLAIWLAYLAACEVAARLARDDRTAGQVALRFAHTLVPIAFAYAFAHYFTLVLFEGQLVFSTLSDPFALGWDLFGTAGRSIDYSLIAGSTTWVWYVQVGVIVAGHVAGVVLAHDRALADFRPDRAVASQYAMLALMVGLTGLGLTILAAG